MRAEESVSPTSQAPKARGDLSLQEVGEEGLLYDREGAMVHILNRTALCAWRLCDGTRSPEAIASALEATFRGADPSRVRQDVERILSEFRERGILERA